MKCIFVLLIMLLLPLISFGELTLQDMEGGSEENVTFRKIDEGEYFSFRVVKSDPTDLSPIRIWNAPGGSQFQNDVFTWTPKDNQSGMYNVSFSISNNTFETIRLVVDNTRFNIRYNKLFEYLFTATDPDNDRVEITVTGLPQGATFVGAQFTPKIFSWIPTKQQIGNHQMMITATDFPDNGQPKQDISIIYIKVTKLTVAEAAYDHYIDDQININDFGLFADNWLKGIPTLEGGTLKIMSKDYLLIENKSLEEIQKLFINEWLEDDSILF